MEHQHYIFIANDISMLEDRKISAVDIKDTLLKQGFWSFTETAPLRAKLKEGDRVLIYLAGPGRREFVAVATIASTAEELENGSEEKKVLSRLGISFLKYKVQLKDIVNFSNAIKIKNLIDKLNFVVDKKNYGLHLRLPIVRINMTDFELILKGDECCTIGDRATDLK